jgi:8-amino-7-oxononanoate synthase
VFAERDLAIAHWQGLLDAGVYTNLMIPPATPSGLNIVRISLSAAHSDEQLDHIVAALEALARRLRP